MDDIDDQWRRLSKFAMEHQFQLTDRIDKVDGYIYFYSRRHLAGSLSIEANPDGTFSLAYYNEKETEREPYVENTSLDEVLTAVASVINHRMNYARFDGMCWTRVDDKMGELQHLLRYGKPSRTDLLIAAGVIAQHMSLVCKTQAERNKICKKIRSTT